MADPASIVNPAAREHTAFACRISAKEFPQTEHLAKHNHTHVQQKHVKCRYCGKAFSRRDAAKRHERLHVRTADAEYENYLSGSRCRTCSTCAKSRIKCSGGTPCKYCATRNLGCVYLPRKRKRSQFNQNQGLRVEGAQVFADVSDNMASSPAASILEHRLRICSGQPNERDSPTPKQCAAVVCNEAETLLASESETVQNQHSHASINGPQWLERSLATNWLPFDDSISLDHMLSSPQTLVPDFLSEAPIGSSNAAEQCDTETIMTLEERPRGPSFTMQQHDCVSALITSMGVNLRSQPENLADRDRSASQPVLQQTLLYADGAGFRSSEAEHCVRRRHEIYATPDPSDDQSEGQTWQSAFASKVRTIEQNPDPRYDISEDVFQDIVSRLCPSSGGPLLSEEFSAALPLLLKRSSLSFLSKLYFTNFHTLYPFIDRSFLCIPIWGWSLTLAVAAIGTRYVGSAKLVLIGEELCIILYELLMKEIQFGLAQDSLPYIQARLLVTISLCQSSQANLLKCGYGALTLVTNSCLQMRLFDEDDRIGAHQKGHSLEQTWIAWRFRETRRRTGCFVWLTDCLLEIAAENPPTLPPRRLKLRMPSTDDLWEAGNAQEWLTTVSKDKIPEDIVAFRFEESTRHYIQDATQKLWQGHAIPNKMPQFSTFIILHMLLRRRWDIGHYLTDPMSTADLPSSRESVPPNGRIVGELPVFTRWRNRTCDTLDLLHWQALSASNTARAFESPVFLQLHLARLIILAPVRELLDHVSAVTQLDVSQMLPHNLYHFPDEIGNWVHTLLTWTWQDRFKARLAVIHAGAVLWHTRRFSAAAFIEPYTIFLATLVLWAYGIAPELSKNHVFRSSAQSMSERCSSRGFATPVGHSDLISGVETVQHANSAVQSEETLLSRGRMPRSMQLDRPMDDELVQHFIRSGDAMRLYLEGVNDLCSEDGPRQILHEGIAVLLAVPKTWAIAEHYASTLAALAATRDME